MDARDEGPRAALFASLGCRVVRAAAATPRRRDAATRPDRMHVLGVLGNSICWLWQGMVEWIAPC
ncbi:MAG TPA: hypothetical protein VNH11_33650 [Pirellulales bacterium]|nr:hypothetical protein [Pirellulales bacterium]